MTPSILEIIHAGKSNMYKERFENLSRVAQKVTSSLDIGDILETIRDEAKVTVPSSREACLLMFDQEALHYTRPLHCAVYKDRINCQLCKRGRKTMANVAFVLRDPIVNSADTIVVGGVMLFWTGFMVYYMFLFVVLPLRLSRCQFKLHTEDPVSTELLTDWSNMMNFAAYMFALMLATGTLFTVTTVTFRLRTLVFIVPRWLPLIALFVVNQVAVYGVITRSKRKSLNEVQAQMAALRPRADPPEHETMETLLWLWDYHDRIKGTRDFILDIKGIMNLINTLLIPLLAFLIANREAIFELLGWSM